MLIYLVKLMASTVGTALVGLLLAAAPAALSHTTSSSHGQSHIGHASSSRASLLRQRPDVGSDSNKVTRSGSRHAGGGIGPQDDPSKGS